MRSTYASPCLKPDGITNTTVMPDFKPVTLCDLEIIRPFFRECGYRTCDYSEGVLYMWAEFFDYQYAVCEDTLFVRGRDVDRPDKHTYLLPVGRLTLSAALEVLCATVKAAGGTELLLNAVPVPPEDIIAPQLILANEHLADWADYLYRASDLATLVGHRYNKKRNRVHAFNAAYPDARLVPLTPQTIADAERFFRAHADSDTRYSPDDPLKVYADYENRKILDVLADYSAFNFEGALLYAGADVIGLTVGEVIGDTLYVHIEKADYSCPGVYQHLNQAFAAFISAKYRIVYINRAEDMGDPGLRQAKQSYYPIEMLEKYNLRISI